MPVVAFGMRPCLFLLTSLALGCSVIVDPGLSYSDCQAAHREETFDVHTLEDVRARCWQDDNVNDPTNVFVDDGDLVIRLSEPAEGKREQWLGADQAPMIYQEAVGDFVLVARVEALDRVTGDHCLDPDNKAGLVLRDTATALEWATVLIGPFRQVDFDCSDTSLAPPPTEVAVRSSDPGSWGADILDWRGPLEAGIGEDGEATLAACRQGNTLAYFYRDPLAGAQAESPWKKIDGDHQFDGGGLDVGLTASGAEPSWDAEGHFNWVILERQIKSDGCAGSLNALLLPEDS